MVLFLETAAALFVQLFILTVGARWAAPLLTRDDSAPPRLFDWTHRHYVAHLVFATTLCTAGSLFLLVFGEIIHLFSKGARSYYWHWNLGVLLALVILIIPWCQVYFFLRQARGWRRRTSAYVSTATWMVYLYMFCIAFSSRYWEKVDLNWMEFGIIRVSVVGITLTSVLSGFGMVHTPFSTWTALTLRVKDSDYRTAQRAYQHILTTIQDKKRLLEQVRPEQGQSAGLLSRMMSGFRLSGHQMLQMEVEQLMILANNMKTDLDELERYWMYHRQSQTWSGRIQCLVDIAFASYCVYKLGMTTWNVLVGRIGNGDPITNLLSWMVAKSNVNIDPAFWSQQLSFWFAGMIVFGSVRGFFKLVSKVLGHFSQAIKLHSDQVLLFTAHLMGLYFLSSVVMMQLNLPSDYRYLLASSLEHIEFTFFQRWADTIGVVSSAITIVVLYVLQRTKDMHGLAQDYAGIELDAVEAGH